MPDGLLSVIGLLAVGYILLLMEIFVPGGILGILGLIAVAYGCYAAFDLGTLWGMAAVTISLVLTAITIRILVKSRITRKLVLENQGAETWKAAEQGLGDLLGRRGTTLTPLRPSGLIEIDDRRIDVVADSEFIESGVEVQICEVEGNRVLVEVPEASEPIQKEISEESEITA